MGTVVNPVGWRLNNIRHWDLYFWSTDLNYSFLNFNFNNLIKIITFYLKIKFARLLSKKNGVNLISIVNFRIVQKSNSFILIFFFKKSKLNWELLENSKDDKKNYNNYGVEKPFSFYLKTFYFSFKQNFQRRKYFSLKKVKKKYNFKNKKNKNIKKEKFPFKSSLLRFYLKREDFLVSNYQSFFKKTTKKAVKKNIIYFLNSYFKQEKKIKQYQKTVDLFLKKPQGHYLTYLKKDDFFVTKKKIFNLKKRKFFKTNFILVNRNYFLRSKIKNEKLFNEAELSNFVILKKKFFLKFLNKLYFFFYFLPLLLFLKNFFLIRVKNFLANNSLKNFNPKILFLNINPLNITLSHFVKWFLNQVLLKKRPFKRNLMAMLKTLNLMCYWYFIKGFQFQVVGRITKKDRALYIWKRNLQVSLTSKIQKIDYFEEFFITKFSTCSIKLWIQV